MIRFCYYTNIDHKERMNIDHIEKVVFDKTIFDVAHTIFKNREMKGNKEAYLSVVDQQGDFLFFCYDDKSNIGRYMFYEETIRCLCKEDKIDNLIKRCHKNFEAIHIQDMNELAYGVYKLCIQHEIPVHLSGRGWDILEKDKSVDLKTYPENAWLHVYSEGRECKKPLKCVESQFLFLQPMGRGRGGRRYLLEEVRRCCANNIQNIIAVSIPFKKQLPIVTKEQEICEKYVVCQGPENIQKKIYGEKTIEYFKERKNGFVDDSQDQYLFSCKIGVPVYKFKGKTGRHRLYVIGPCIVFGRGCLAEDSFCYRLQACVEDYGYVVMKIGIDNKDLPMKIKICDQLPIQEHDIILFVNTHQYFDEYSNRECPVAYEGIMYIDTLEAYESVAGKENWYSDVPPHTNALGNMRLVEYIYDNGLKEMLHMVEKQATNHYIQRGSPLDEKTESMINEYIDKIKKQYEMEDDRGVRGAIVMNCNPFTKGHRYLIDIAAKHVDMLYVFVVEENKSRFSFRERFDLVRLGTRDIKNVKVIPSGRFILSYETMPLYFSKSECRTEKLDASQDLEVFSRYIAPALGITIRFVGEEPYDPITRQYNEQMAYILPEFGIDLYEIPRLHMGGEAISASMVRKLLDEGNWEMLKEYVPVGTYLYLRKHTYLGLE